MKSAILPSSHYAAKWSTTAVRTTEEVTSLGLAYTALPEGDARGSKQLEILQCFHGYIVKYLGMILMGHIPFRGGEINKDTELMLRCFIPKGQPVNRATLGLACRTLHLAFKGMDASEVYDALMMCMVRAVNSWNPKYHERVQEVVKLINEKFQEGSLVTHETINANLDFDGTRYLRVLVKRGYLSVSKSKIFSGAAPAAWPPPQEFLQPNKPVGLVYYASKWFRYYLTDWIIWRMGELESRQGVLQLDHRRLGSTSQDRDYAVPHANGEYTLAQTGKSIAADMSMTRLPVDVGTMDFSWVNSKSDGFFGSLTPKDRQLLYCVYVREMEWEAIAATMDDSVREVKRQYNCLMKDLRERAAIWPTK